MAAAPVNTGILVVVVLLDIVVNLKAEVVVVPTTTEELRICEATDEVIAVKVIDGVVVGVVFGQLIEDSSEDKAR